MSGFLLDTNVLSELVKPKPNPRVVQWVNQAQEETLYLSVLTVGEIRKGVALLPQSPKRARIESWLERDLQERFYHRILPITDRIADRWGLLAARAHSHGNPLHVVDGLMAATALEHNLTLVTRKTKDVDPAGVPVQNPWL